MKGFTTMYDYRGKISGIIISAIGLALMVAERIHPFTISGKWNPEQNYSLFLWIMMLGLFLIMYSKEKIEDERNKLIRLKAFQISFMIMVGTMLAFCLTSGTANQTDLKMEGKDLYIFPAIGIFTYLLVFHVGLYFDEAWDYEDKGLITNLKNIKRNGLGYLAYLVVCIILMILLILL
jgi:hypothetical protein